MNNEQFEDAMKAFDDFFITNMTAGLRARDTAQRETLARVEAERDLAVSQRDHNLYSARLMTEAAEEAQAHLAEAVGLLRYAMESSSFREILTLERDIAAFLARNAQAEQQEAREPVMARPEHGVSMDEALSLTMNRYSGALDKLAVIEQQEAQGAQVVAERSAAEQAYVEDAFDYSVAPIGSRDWTLYWKGWQARAALATQPVVPEVK